MQLQFGNPLECQLHFLLLLEALLRITFNVAWRNIQNQNLPYWYPCCGLFGLIDRNRAIFEGKYLLADSLCQQIYAFTPKLNVDAIWCSEFCGLVVFGDGTGHPLVCMTKNIMHVQFALQTEATAMLEGIQLALYMGRLFDFGM